MRRNIFFLLLLLFFALSNAQTVLAITISQEVLPATDSSGPPVLVTPSSSRPVVVPPVSPIVPPPMNPPIEISSPTPSSEPAEVSAEVPSSISPEETVPLSPAVETPSASPVIKAVSVITERVREIFKTTSEVVNSPVVKTVTKVAEPLGIASGVALVAFQTIVSTATMTVTSVSDIYLLTWRLLGLLFGVGKKRGRPWGTVYDSVTKRPLDPAYVIVSRESGEEVSDAITDLDGRYGFLVPSGFYKLKANKTNYSFPTKNLENKGSDEIYDNIYHGEIVNVKEGDVVVRNIPLDPIGFDWNEFEKNKQNLFRIYSDRERFWKKIFDIFYAIGLGSSIVATIFDPRTINIVFLGLYVVFILYSFSIRDKKRAVSVKYAKNSEPIPFAVIKIFFAELNNQVKTVVADHMGRFYFLVGPGKYYFTIDKKQPDGSYLNVHRSQAVDLPNGVLGEDILV